MCEVLLIGYKQLLAGGSNFKHQTMTSYSSKSNSNGLSSKGLDHVYIQFLSIDLADLKQQACEATAIAEQERS
jgi:hypothetical protein